MKFLLKIINVLVLFVFLTLSFIELANAASASMSISGGRNANINENINFIVSVYGSSSYNAVTLSVNFSNLTFISATPQGWTPVSGPSNSYGNVSFSGATLGSASTGSKSVLALSFKTTSFATNYSISASGSIALADGNGTQVPASSGTYSYNTSKPSQAPITPTSTPGPTQIPVPATVVISSSTHPDQSKWYQAKNVVLNWDKGNGVSGYAYSFDQNQNINPDLSNIITDNSKTFTNANDGITYFKMQAKNESGWSAISTYTIHIDSQTPDPFTITKANELKGFKLFFATNDSLSGINRYTLSVDGKDIGAQNTGYVIPTSALIVMVTAFDNAGNSTESTMNVTNTRVVNAVATAQITQIPTRSNSSKSDMQFYILVGTAVLFLIYSVVITYIYFKKTGLLAFGKKGSIGK